MSSQLDSLGLQMERGCDMALLINRMTALGIPKSVAIVN